MCELGCEITRIILESYDNELATFRDTKQYRDKGGRKTSIKTVYGDVVYWRRVYQTSLEDGEKHAVKQINADQTEGEKEIPVLFEEMDGVWLNMQDEHHKKMKKQELKVFTMYEGWMPRRKSRTLLCQVVDRYFYILSIRFSISSVK